jgi:hypothetical protein
MSIDIYTFYWIDIVRQIGSSSYPMPKSILSIHMNGYRSFRIYKYTVTTHETYPAPEDMTAIFLRFQKKVRDYVRKNIYMRRNASRWMRSRELCHAVHNLADLYNLRLRSSLRLFY